MDGGTSVIISKIAVPTKDLSLKVIQEVLHQVRTCQRKQNKHSGWNEILKILWEHLQTGFKQFDAQLLCSVCFYTTLESSSEKVYYLDRILTLISNEYVLNVNMVIFCSKEQTFGKARDLLGKSKKSQAVSLMYGILQSKFIINVSHIEVPKIIDVLKSSLKLLITMAYEYSRYTFITFKIISFFKVVYDTDLQEILFSKVNHSTLGELTHLVNHNWENPITGVRDLNKSIFEIIISMSGCGFISVKTCYICTFPWNKAKYLMLAILLESPNSIEIKKKWIDGLLHSLSKPGLVSAGADMYYAAVNKIRTEDEWCSLFLNKLIVILCSSCTKAIENFCNYWCLATFKKFPVVSNILIQELNKQSKSEAKLHSSLCILKQANKLGLIEKKWDTNEYTVVENTVLEGIEHCNPRIRMLAFEIVAVTLGKNMPTPIEYKLILNYLGNNVNSDCTVLRISMLGSIKCFLTNLCASYMNHAKHRKNYEADDLQKYYKDLQEFMINSLNLDGNYQRKSTTIKLCSILLSSLADVSKKRQKQKSSSGTAMIQFLKERDCFFFLSDNFLMKLFALLKDPADDIRDNVVQLLLDHYSKQITGPLFNQLIEDAKECIGSKFFFKISCGQSIFKLITSLLLKESYKDTVFTSIDEVFRFAFDVLKSEYKLKRDIVKSIEDGKQLHAYLCIMQVVLKTSKQFSYEMQSLRDEIPQILMILEDMSNQFALEEEPAVSSDFSKMSDKVQDIIASSGYNPMNEKDLAKISGLQQIVLNCLWLNVKASCDFASYLLTFFNDDEDLEASARCLHVITHVLETSRHKGAIEAAGAALGRAVQYLTSLPEESALSGVPRSVLAHKLRRLVASGGAASVTRRGAGLTIMLHRIVASDMHKEKPLFHYFMEKLLQTCNSSEAPPTSLEDGQKDVPKAIYIHLFTRVVTDSGLASDMMFYSADLAEIAFDNLTSPHWQIRNAALQLYGALIPKLIGQKKASGADDETVATVALDELLTHFPKLYNYMTETILQLDNNNPVESHSNFLPVLNVLANLAKAYQFDDADIMFSSPDIFDSLLVLLGSPIYTVRRLTAKYMYTRYGYGILGNIITKIERQKSNNENLLHGALILAGQYKNSPSVDEGKFRNIMEKLSELLSRGCHSYMSRRQFERVYSVDYNIEEVLLEAKHNKYLSGVHDWAKNRLQNYIQTCPWPEIPNILNIILAENEYEKYCEFILDKLEVESAPKNTLINISENLLQFNYKFQSSVVWKILYHISLKIEHSNIDLCILKHLEEDIPYRIRFIIPFFASLAASIPMEYLMKLSNIIFSLCNPDKSDVDMRYIAALANNELAKVFPKIQDSIRITAIKCAVLLLQDEDEDVRMMNVHFYTNIQKGNQTFHPYVCLNKILDKHFLQCCLDDHLQGISVISQDLLDILVSYGKSGDIDEYNPFSNDSKNIYFESEVVKKLIENISLT